MAETISWPDVIITGRHIWQMKKALVLEVNNASNAVNIQKNR
jgi:hypothetical protein